MAPPPRKFVIAGQEYYTTPSATGGSLPGPGFSFPQVTPQQFYTWATKPISEDVLSTPVSEEEKQALYQKGYEFVEPHLGATGAHLPGIMAGQIKAFHGSPYKFDKFKSEKIGTGEGAQAFGHGLYFTSEKDIAKHHATAGLLHDKGVKLGDEVFTSKGTVGSTANEVDYAVDALVRFDGDKKKALNWLSGGGMHINAKEWIRKNIQTDKAEIVKAEGPTITSRFTRASSLGSMTT